MSLTELIPAIRAVPTPVRELIIEIIRIILGAKNPALTARKAVEAIRTKAIDEGLKKEFSNPPPLPHLTSEHKFDSKGFDITDAPSHKPPPAPSAKKHT